MKTPFITLPMKNIAIVGLLALQSASALALDIPAYSPRDTNIQHTQYRADDVVAITAGVGMATHIIFSPGETIEQVKTGFSEGWETESVGNHLFLKARSAKAKETYLDEEGNEVVQEITLPPTPAPWRTNLLVVTNQRNYTFLLTLGSGDSGRRNNTFRLTFDYPQQVSQAQQQANDKAAIARRQAAAPVVKNNDYVMQVGRKSRAIAPVAAFDDGTFTYLTFASKGEIPAVFIVAEDGSETLVNTHINPARPDTLVMQRLAPQWVLRLNDAVVGVTNRGFARAPATPVKGSTVKGVTRDVTGGGA
ncbi:MAG: P-type conjugative transfer protein VirB9 [Plesiomonas shigelloides]